MKCDSTKDLLQLIRFVLKKFFKKVQEDPFVIVQALEPKTRKNWKDLSSYKSDDESDDDGMGGQQARIQEKVRNERDVHINDSWRERLQSLSSRRTRTFLGLSRWAVWSPCSFKRSIGIG